MQPLGFDVIWQTNPITSPPSCSSPLFAIAVLLSCSPIFEWCNQHWPPIWVLWCWVFLPLSVSNFEQWMTSFATLRLLLLFSLIHDNCTQGTCTTAAVNCIPCHECHIPELCSLQATLYGHAVKLSSWSQFIPLGVQGGCNVKEGSMPTLRLLTFSSTT